MPQPTAPTPSLMSTRALARGPSSVVVESRTFEAVLTSEHPVRTWIPAPNGNDYIEVDEVLLTSGVDLSRARGMPLLDSHCAWGIDHHLGQVDAIRAEVVAGVGECLVISARVKPSRAEIVAEMADGFHPNLSAGYVVHEYELVQRAGDVPLARATRWTLLEASLVPIGADPNASVRSGGAAAHPLPTVRVRTADPATTQDSDTMDLETQIAAAEAAIAAADTAIAALPAETPAGTAEALSLRAAAVRKRAAVTEKPPESQAGGDSGETDDEKAKREADAAAEKAAIEGVRSIAKTYGAEVSKLADDLAALGSPAAEIRAAVRSEVAARGAATPSTTVQPSTRSAAPEPLDTRSIYAAWNKR